METKVCTKCEREKELAEFYKSGKYIKSWCKSCFNEGREDYSKKNYRKNVDKYITNTRQWKKENADRHKELKRTYKKHKYETDPLYRHKHLLRGQVHHALKGKIKDDTTFNLLGYTAEDFINRFDKDIQQFKANRIKHNIDHRIPLEWFIDGTPIKIMFDLRNLQIISEEDNSTKQHYFPSITDKSFLEQARQHIKPEFLCW